MSKVRLKQLASQADSGVLIYDASGNPIYLGPGQDQYPLVGRGTGLAPEFKKLPLGGLDIAGSAPGEHLEISPGGIAAWLPKPTGGGSDTFSLDDWVYNGTSSPAAGKVGSIGGNATDPSTWNNLFINEIADGGYNWKTLLEGLGPGTHFEIDHGAATPFLLKVTGPYSNVTADRFSFPVSYYDPSGTGHTVATNDVFTVRARTAPTNRTLVFENIIECTLPAAGSYITFNANYGWTYRLFDQAQTGQADFKFDYLGPIMPAAGVWAKVTLTGKSDTTTSFLRITASKVTKNGAGAPTVTLINESTNAMTANTWTTISRDFSSLAAAQMAKGDQLGLSLSTFDAVGSVVRLNVKMGVGV